MLERLHWVAPHLQHAFFHSELGKKKDLTPEFANEYIVQSWADTEGRDLLSFILDALSTPGPVWVDLIIGMVVVGGAWYWLPDIEGHVFYHSEVGKRKDLTPIFLIPSRIKGVSMHPPISTDTPIGT